MTRIFLAIATLLAGFSVAGGAFTSHALKTQLSARALNIFQTGIKYQMYHALALLVVGLLLSRAEASQRSLIATGCAIFSGSLYVLSLTGIVQNNGVDN